MNSTLNPFFISGSVSDAKGFFGRQELVKDIVNILTNTRQNIILLHGQRRIGKSSLLYRLQRDEILQQTRHAIVFDMQTYEGLTLPRILYNLAVEIRKPFDEDIPLPTEEELAADSFVLQKTFLPQIYERLAGKPLLLLIDEFDAMSKGGDDSSNNAFLIYLRSLLAEAQSSLAFVFVISQRLDKLGDNYLRLIKAASAKPVGRFKEPEAVKLLTDLGAQGDMSFTEEALTEIWRLTSGHPYLTQLFGQETFERLRTSDHRQVDLAAVTACENRAIEIAEAVLTWFWKDLARVERLILTAIAELTDSEEGIDDAKINETLQKHSLTRTHSERRDAYKFLIDDDFLVDTGQQHYKFAVEIIRRWVVQRHPLEEAKREMEQIGVEALNHYQAGDANFRQGNLAEAIKNYRQALDHNPNFADAWLGLAAALNGAREQEEAIAACENAYDLRPAEARSRLIGLRMDYAKDLGKSGKQPELLAQTERVLEIDPDHPQAREIVSNIWLKKIEASLLEGNFPEAKDLVNHLVEPAPLVQDAAVAQRIRKLWLGYSHRLSQEQPDSVQALIKAKDVLHSLAEFDLKDDSVKEALNDLTIEKARVFLADDHIKPALETLALELEQPLPADKIKELLLRYSRQLIARQAWLEADQILQTLVELVKDQDSTEAQLALYHAWGDALRHAEQFDQAVEIYQRGPAKAFKPKIAQAYFEQGQRYLAQEQLAQVKSSYQQALAAHRSKTMREEARQTLVDALTRYRAEYDWGKATHTLQILQDLDLAGKDGDGWQTDLQFEQAEDELSEGRLDPAFARLTEFAADQPNRIKLLVKNHIQHAARQGHWAAGHEALKRLETLLPQDSGTTFWRANWLFLWAKACFPKETRKKNPDQAWDLCQKILSFAPEGTPRLDLLTAIDAPPEKQDGNLRQHTCHLATDIALEQAQARLDQVQLAPARERFEAVLDLPIPPDGLKQKIRDMLLVYNQSQTLKEQNREAQQALETILALELGDQREMIEAIKEIPVTEARLLFKADRPDKAFISLEANQADLSDEERDAIKAMVYQFSRLYAGRNRWDEARQALAGLQEWLASHGDDIAPLRDMLNREHLTFIKGRVAPVPVPPAELDRLGRELDVAKAGYQEARALGLESAAEWADDLIGVGLTLGQSHLSNDNLDDAVTAFEEILEIETPVPIHREQINQNLHNYSERVLNVQDWGEAGRALGRLKTFNLAAPDGQTRPDPRVDGAIQRVNLAHIQHQLEHDLLLDVFKGLEDRLPTPRPTGELKKIIFKYSEDRRQQNDWKNASKALEQLDGFLEEDHKARDQQTLGEWVSCLELWGNYLEQAGDPDQAAAKYKAALEQTRQAAHPRHLELAEHFIRVTLQLAQESLAKDPRGPEPSPALDNALGYCQAILKVEECNPTQQEAVNTTLYDHVYGLTTAGQWPRASELLDGLDKLYAPAPPEAYKTTFAGWRRDLVVGEVEKRLKRPQPDRDQAFKLLEDLKTRLERYKAAEVSWRASQNQVKAVVNKFCRHWCDQNEWAWAADTLERLSQLIPEDEEVVGWQVETLCSWGQHLQRENFLAEAIDQFGQALRLAPKQKAMPHDTIAEYLLQVQLAQAKQHLNDWQVQEAVRTYGEILQKPPEYLDRADQIRQAVMAHCETLVGQNPPEWRQAHELRGELLALALDNDPVQRWHEDLTLRHMKMLLRQREIERALDSLNNLVGDWPMTDIQQVIKQFVGDQAKADTWQDALDALVHFGERNTDDEAVRVWVNQELIILGNNLRDQQDLPGSAAREAYRRAEDFVQTAAQ